MSFEILRPAYHTTVGNSSAKAVLILMADHCTPEGTCFPSIRHIAQMTELSERQVMRVIQVFRDIGLVTRHSVKNETYEYYFSINIKMLGSDISKQVKEALSSVGKRNCPEDTCPEDGKSVPRTAKGVLRTIPPTTPNKEEPSFEPFSLASQGETLKTEKTLHSQVQEYIFSAYRSIYRTDPSWNGREGKALSELISANPTWDFLRFQKLIDNRYASDGVNGDRPGAWLPNLSRYMAGPLDAFNRPKFQRQSPAAIKPKSPSQLMREELAQ